MINTTSKTLLEQLQITEYEIARRKELLGFSEADVSVLLSCKELVTQHIDSIVSDFYSKQTAVEEIALLIGDSDTLARLHSAQRAYVLGLFDGYYDIEYVNNRLRIGMVHKRIGVEPKLYLSAIKTLKDGVFSALSKHIGDIEQRTKAMLAVDKLLYFDTTLVFDTYIRSLLAEVELAKDKIQSYAKELEVKVAERTQQLQELSRRDSLTGLFNQRSLRDDLRRELLIATRHKRPLSLAYFDVDLFKQINDKRGHFAGDEILRMVAEAMQSVCRKTDFPCRYGGDEFCLIFPECSLTEAETTCDRLVAHFESRVRDVTLSIGIIQTGPEHFLEPDELLRLADAKMYEAKSHAGFKICT